jgi:hypothetical protein
MAVLTAERIGEIIDCCFEFAEVREVSVSQGFRFD